MDKSVGTEEPALTGDAIRDRQRRPEPEAPSGGRRSSALFPEHANPAREIRLPSRFVGVREALTERRNAIPLGLIVALGLVAAVLFTRRPAPPAVVVTEPPQARLSVSSSKPSTSLFANETYLGEIGPTPREFTLAPGRFRLRLIRSHCRAGDTLVEVRAGETLKLGPVDPICGT